MRENNGEDSGLATGQVAGWLEEDQKERQRFDERVKEGGGHLKYIREVLQIWSLTSPQQGTYAKMCAIMANELGKTMAGIEGNTRPHDPVKAELVKALEKAARIGIFSKNDRKWIDSKVKEYLSIIKKKQVFRINGGSNIKVIKDVWF